MDSLAAVSPRDLIPELLRRRLVVPASGIRQRSELIQSGLEELDRIAGGGLPVGGITEVVAPRCGGATVLYALLAGATSRGMPAALVDPREGFDAASAQSAGVVLDRLLWVRAQVSSGEARWAVEQILAAGGIGVVALDTGVRRGKTGDAESARPAPAAWMRIQRLAAAASAVVLVIAGTDRDRVGPPASLSVAVRRRRASWRGHLGQRWLEGIELSFELLRARRRAAPKR